MPESQIKYFNSPNQFVGCPNFGYWCLGSPSIRRMAYRNLWDGGDRECYPDMRHNTRQCNSWCDFIMKNLSWKTLSWKVRFGLWCKLSQFQLQSQPESYWEQCVTDRNIEIGHRWNMKSKYKQLLSKVLIVKNIK